MFVPSINGNTYIMTFINYYTKMYGNINHKLLKYLKNFMYGFKMKLSLVLALSALIMDENIHLMNLKSTFANVGSNIKPSFHTIPNKTVWLNE
jgi:hypothetical protein